MTRLTTGVILSETGKSIRDGDLVKHTYRELKKVDSRLIGVEKWQPFFGISSQKHTVFTFKNSSHPPHSLMNASSNITSFPAIK